MRYDIPHEFLTTRTVGEELRVALEGELRAVHRTELLEIDFTGVSAMTISFTDEFLGKLLSFEPSSGDTQRQIVLLGLNEDTATEVDVALGRRGLFVVGLADGERRLLGGDVYLRDTFEAAARHSEFKATDLAADLGVSVQNVNNRLKNLVSKGALMRTRRDPDGGGREYVYKVPVLCS